MKPAVTVVVPTYNQLRYLKEAVESVRRQTFRGVELIVVDDASSDGTAAWCRAQTGLRFLRLSRRSGTAAARNAGLRRARGRFVAFLDHDDLWQPSFLETLLARLGDPRIEMAAANVDLVDGRGRVLLAKAIGASGKADRALRAVTGLARTPCMSACVFRRSTLEALGGLDERFVTLDDLDLFYRLAERHGHRAIVFIDRALGAYRRHAGQQTAIYGRYLGDSAGLARAFLRGKATTPAQRAVLLDMAYFFTKHAPGAPAGAGIARRRPRSGGSTR